MVPGIGAITRGGKAQGAPVGPSTCLTVVERNEGQLPVVSTPGRPSLWFRLALGRSRQGYPRILATAPEPRACAKLVTTAVAPI
jgi:hypothetical protein